MEFVDCNEHDETESNNTKDKKYGNYFTNHKMFPKCGQNILSVFSEF